MTASLLLCWYSLGFVACGLNFTLFDKNMRDPIFLCLTIPPVMIAFMVGFHLVCAIARYIPRIDQSKQYLWRKP
jgi:hypothetical protein